MKRDKKGFLLLIALLISLILQINGIAVESVFFRSAEGMSISIILQSEQEKKIKELIVKLGAEHWEETIEALGEIGEPAVEPLIRAMGDYSGHRYKPYRAAIALGRIGSKSAEDALIQALGDTDTQDYVYRGIIRGLAEIGSETAEKTLLEIVQQKDLDRLIRGLAADALSVFNADKTIDVLVETLKDKEENVRYSAGGALAKIGSKKAMEALFEGMRSDLGFLLNPSVREAVEKDGSEAAIVILIDALKSDEWFVWQSASELLEKIGEKAEAQLIGALDSASVRTRRKAALLLGECQSEKAVEFLIQSLEDPDGMVRDEAAVALAKIQSKKAVEPLMEVLQKGSPQNQEHACWILGELKTEEVVEQLILVLEDGDPEVKLWASAALEKISSPQAMKALQEIYPPQISYEQENYTLYPETLDFLPDIPSPYTTESGIETVVAATQDGSYTLIPVTVENGAPYVYARTGRGRQLEIDALDFPTLARTGLHSEKELDTTKAITGVSISEITDIGRPGRLSGVGFMSEDEDVISVLKGDNRLVKKMGLTHPQLARALFHAVNLTFKHTEVYYDQMRPWEDIEYFLYNGKKVFIEGNPTKGWQESLFDDEIYGGYHIYIKRELDEEEKNFLQQKYQDLNKEQMSELIEKLSHMHTGEIEPYYIMRYGFYEGHTDYRTDPIAIAFIFGLRSLEEIEDAFPGRLYETLMEHFSGGK